MINLTNVSLQRGPKVLLDNVNLTLHVTQKVGIIGENGAGKSSLFALLRGILTSDAGSVNVPAHLEIAHLDQEIPALSTPAIEYVIDGDTELRQIEKQLEETDDGNLIAELHGRLYSIDGYAARARAAQLMFGLGFTTSEQTMPVSAFSGGWRMRLNLAKTLMCRSNLLLLDEPTNHLDLDAIVWLENWLKNYPGTLLVISHDRDFLDAIATHIIQLENKQLNLYTGNYSSFEEQKAMRLALQQAHYEKQQRQRAHLQSFIDRFKAKATKARQAQSRMKALARIEMASAAHVDSPFQFGFREPLPCSNPLLALEHITLGYPEKTILKNVSITFSNQARIGLIGPNGAGKSTFIKLLAGKLEPLKGERTANPSLKIGYFEQHQLDTLDLEASALLHLQRIDPKGTEQEFRNFLGSFGFIGDQALTPIAPFSGGEKARLALALIIWQKPNLLLLDEPTNHLDLEMRHALTMALQDYQGAMIVVSHDRHLLRATTDSLLLVANQQVSEFNGDLETYQQWLLENRREDSTEHATQNNPKKSSEQSSSKEQRNLLNKIKKIEEDLAKLHAEKKNIETLLIDDNLYSSENNPKLQQLLNQQNELLKKIENVETSWVEVQELLEAFNS